MSLYVACAGDIVVNGVYDEVSLGWQKRDNEWITITLINNEWTISNSYYSGSNTITHLYKLPSSQSPINETGWVILNGTGPAPKTYNYIWSEPSLNTIGVYNAGAPEVNGIYTKGISELLGTVYYHSSGLFYIVQWYGNWRIWSIPGHLEYYYASINPAEPPSTEGGWPAEWITTGVAPNGPEPAPTSSLEMSAVCATGGNGGAGGSGYFVYTKNNVHYVRLANNQPYVYAAPRTLYFNGAVDNEWTELGNWWTDSAHTVPATALPAAVDDVVASASINSNSGSEPTVVNFTMYDPGEEYVYSIMSISVTVTDTATFNGRSANDNGTIINGDATFNDSSANGGTVTGNATFNDGSANDNGTIGSNATFNDSSYNYGGTVNGDATFNDSSINGGTVNGDATFNDSSSNYVTVTGDATFNGYSSNIGTVSGDATFNNSSVHAGAVGGDARFNDTSMHADGSTVGATAVYTSSACNDGGTAAYYNPDPPPMC